MIADPLLNRSNLAAVDLGVRFGAHHPLSPTQNQVVLRSTGYQAGHDLGEELLVWIAAGKVEDDSSDRDSHSGRDFQELEANGLYLGGRKFCAFKCRAPQVLKEDISGGSQEQAELVGHELVATGTVCKEGKLLFLDTVFHVTPCDI